MQIECRTRECSIRCHIPGLESRPRLTQAEGDDPFCSPRCARRRTMLHRTLGSLGVVALLLAGTAASAAEVKGKMITFKSGEEEIKGFLAEPECKGPFPAIVVIQEWWGLTDWIKDNARKLAAQGYVC